MQNVKNKMVFFKSNTYYFKKQKLIRRRKRRIPLFSLFSTNLKRNWFFLKNRSSNFFVFHNMYLLNIKNFFFLKLEFNLYDLYFLIINTIPFLKKYIYNLKSSLIIIYIIYIFFLLIIFFINKNFFSFFFISNKFNKKNIDLNFKFKNKINHNIFTTINLNKKNLYMYKFFLFKLTKKFNFINFFFKKKYFFVNKFYNLRLYLNHASYDQYNKNIPLYKNISFFLKFVNVNKFSDYVKKYTKFFYIQKFPFLKILNDFLMFSELNYRKHNVDLQYKKLADCFYFNYIYLYWIILIPFFLFNI